MAINRLNLFFPEWQGFGVDNRTYHGAHWIRRQLLADWPFVEVDIPDDEPATTDGGIFRRASIVRNTRQTLEILDEHRPDSLFVLGGTCAVEVAPASYLAHRHDNDLSVIWLDAHGDLNTPSTSPSSHFHGMPLRTLLGDGDQKLIRAMPSTLSPDQVVLLGARDLDPPERDYIRDHHLACFGCDAPVDRVVDQLAQVGRNKLYIHLDLDVLNRAEFDQTVFPLDNGLRIADLLQLLQALHRQFDVVGCSLLEFVGGSVDRREDLRAIIDGLVGGR